MILFDPFMGLPSANVLYLVKYCMYIDHLNHEWFIPGFLFSKCSASTPVISDTVVNTWAQ